MSVAPGCYEENSDSREFFDFRKEVVLLSKKIDLQGINTLLAYFVHFLESRWQNAIIGPDYGN